MGTWNPKPFGNDTALDWLAGLKTSPGSVYLMSTIQSISQSKDPLGAEECEQAVAVCAVIATAATRFPTAPIRSLEAIRAIRTGIRSWGKAAARLQSAPPPAFLYRHFLERVVAGRRSAAVPGQCH